MRYDLISPRKKGDGGTFWVKVGAAFTRDNGGFSLMFDALPLPDAEGRCALLMVEPKERTGAPQQPSGRREPEDEIPF